MKKTIMYLLVFSVFFSVVSVHAETGIFEGKAPWGGNIRAEIDGAIMEHYEIADVRPHMNEFGTRVYVTFIPKEALDNPPTEEDYQKQNEFFSHVNHWIMDSRWNIAKVASIMTMKHGESSSLIAPAEKIIEKNGKYYIQMNGAFVLRSGEIAFLEISYSDE